MLRKNVIRRAPMLLPLLLLLTACASKSPRSSSAPTIQPLRPEARQPATPSICSPTCSAGLTKLRESWRNTLTVPASPASSASATTTH
ncbi:Rz-like spanin [Burkholderia phage vB_BmuP_KL4]|uniref:Rz1 n=1 Tax=Burkholderia phage vB_BmuP_KL4 TaxID=2115967 RepID=A0A2S1GN76_9CAUD|nr:Rz-like spanin [Burkholderia phage vB_BmuP_KL4]AWD90836.1 Rz1 [Burkholderia phage vB_BmuP_KL4]